VSRATASGAMVHAQLSVRVGDMTLDGGETDDESIGDLLVRMPAAMSRKIFNFSRCERLREANYGESGRDGNG